MTARKANTPPLTREQIVEAAIRLVDREGLDALSMRGLATELGVGTMTVYYHVDDKSALYDLILDAVMSDVDASADDPTKTPRERISGMARAFRRALLAHPSATPIAAGRSMRTAVQLRPVEAMLGVLLDAGMEPAGALRTVNVIGQFVIGTAAMHASHLTESGYHEDQIQIDPAEFPNLMATMDEPGDWDADFEAGLQALVQGLVPDRKQA
ncbi:MAG: TetR/AcrR family transcriptional regulator C-terminal domain-containing protein [Coriobacteriia bacterium]